MMLKLHLTLLKEKSQIPNSKFQVYLFCTILNGLLQIKNETVGLVQSDDLWIDVEEFHRCLAECERHGHPIEEVCPDCVRLLTHAVELYRDDFLAGFSLKDSVVFDDWQFSQTQDLRSKVINTLKRLVHWHSDQEEFEAAIGYARRWLEMDRTSESAHRQLMEFYAQTGQRAAALRQYDECVRILDKELKETPKEETTKLYEAIKKNILSVKREVEVSEPFPRKPKEAANHNLPVQLTSFIGREKEMEEVKRLLSTTRLLTSTGSGGCGKTRLALQVVGDLLEEYPDGVWVVELASLSDPGLVTQETASVLGIREESGVLTMAGGSLGTPTTESDGEELLTRLTNCLKSKHLLLFLDNCEHLIDACIKLVDVLLHGCPNLKIIVASREVLGIASESTYRVPSLSTPDLGNMPPLEKLARYESINLFIDRAVAAVSTFRITEDNAPAVAQICYRLDGIPLAIELAAARVRVLEVEEITNRLDDRFRMLTGGSRTALPRQQTLSAMIDWSYNLLSEGERALFNRTSVFMGGWTLEAAEAICAGGNVDTYDVLDLLTSLVEKSLVAADGEGGKKRYRLLETVRQYARDRLMDSGERAGLRDQQLEWYLDLAERADPELRGPDQVKWLKRLDIEHDNMRAALEWSMEQGETEIEKRHIAALRLAGALFWFWWSRNYLSEGRRWLEGALTQSPDASVSIKAKALGGAGWLAQVQGDPVRAKELFDQSLTLYRELGDKGGVAHSLIMLGFVALNQGDYDLVIARGQEGLNLAREVGDKGGVSVSLLLLGMVAMDHGEYERATDLYQESLALAREMGDKGSIAWSIKYLGIVTRYQGKYKQARALFEESETLFRERGDREPLTGGPNNLALIELGQGDYTRSKSMFEKSLEVNRELGDKSGMARDLDCLGFIAGHQGDYQHAIRLHKESLTLFLELGDKRNIPWCLVGMALVARKQGQLEQAARLFGAVEVMRRGVDIQVPPPYRDDHDKILAVLRAELGEETFAKAWEEGRKMSMEEAIELAMED